jgi:peptide/nickel transport system substrate-binding protein
MKDTVKKESRSEIKSSMKDALSSLESTNGKKAKKKKKGKDFRDILWDYPIFLSKLFKNLIPLSYIFLFGIVGVGISFILESNVIARILDDSTTNDTFTEGAVGAISTFNPLFVSVNYVDRTVQELVFDRFVYIDKDGNPLPGIAKEWSVSEDRLNYEFKIANNVYWHDGSELSVDDVIFTFKTAKALSEEYGFDSVGISLVGVEIEKKSKNEVVFKLKEPNPTFFEAVSLFIVPKSRLENIDLGQLAFDMFARYPIGTGRYKVTRTEQNAVYLTDNSFDKFEPTIRNIVFKIFPDKQSMEMSFRIGVLDAVGGWDYDLLKFTEEYSNLEKYTKSEEYRTKLLFFNTRRDMYKEKDIRIGLNYLIDRKKLVEESNIQGNIRLGLFPETSWVFNNQLEYYNYNPERAAEYFSNIGFTKNEESGYFESSNQEILSFTISYFDSITNERLISSLKEILKEEGVVLKSEKLNYNQITQEIIATRDFDILLYEIETTVDPDQYNLWHSLKSNHPDLNISGYSYERVDILLEDARKTSDRTVRKQKYDLFQKYVMADAPVVFLYNPTFFYFVKNSVEGIALDGINYSYERFHNVQNWELK